MKCPLRSKWAGLVVVCIGLLAGGLVALGYQRWPNIHYGCEKYNCTYIIDWEISGCFDSEPNVCIYFWLAEIDGVISNWRWGATPSNLTGIPTTNTTFVYANNTVCYRPRSCDQEGFKHWIEGRDCFPTVTCTNVSRLYGRTAYIFLSSLVVIMSTLGILGYWLYVQSKYPKEQYALIQ